MQLLTQNITVVSEAEYRQYEAVAPARIPRDPNDWPTVAVALALDAGIWTHDYDFFGCGIPVWITETLLTPGYVTLARRRVCLPVRIEAVRLADGEPLRAARPGLDRLL